MTTATDAPATRRVVAAAGLLFAAWVTVAALVGPQNADNALPGVFYVLLWVGLVALSLLIGPVWRLLSPARTVYRLVPLSRRPAPMTYPEPVGYWPAAVGLFTFVWLERQRPRRSDQCVGVRDRQVVGTAQPVRENHCTAMEATVRFSSCSSTSTLPGTVMVN